MTIRQVHHHGSAPGAFFVNSFIIEGERSLVLVDTQFVLSEATAVTDKLAALGKPLAGVVVTHPHPDHYNGLATVLARHPGVPVFATAATIAGIRETAEPKRAYWTPIVGADYPQSFAFPDVTVADGESLKLDGMELGIVDLGALECSNNTMVLLPQLDAVITSDLVYHAVHPWLAEGRSARWLRVLEDVERRFGGAAAYHAGHGGPGSARVLAGQADYLRRMRELVAEAMAAPDGLSPTRREALARRVEGLYPGWPLAMIIGVNIDGIATELASGG